MAQQPQPRLERISHDLLSELKAKLDGKLFAMDFETWGTNWMAPGFWVRCVSFHNDDISISVDLATTDGDYYPFAYELFEFLAGQQGIVAHNAGYEIGCLYAMTGQTVVPRYCTYALVMYLACEGSPGQSAGLKQAGPELTGVDRWDKGLGSKADLAKLPFEELGRYNQWDSFVTWELLKICQAATEEFTVGSDGQPAWGSHFETFIEEDFTNILMLQDEAYKEGLYIDPGYVAEYLKQVEADVERTRNEFFQHPLIAPEIAEYNRQIIDQAKVLLAAYPKKIKADGTETLNYIKAKQKVALLEKECHFSLGSSKDLRWLFYDRLKCEIKITTDSGAPSTDADALAGIPVFGKLLLAHRDEISQRQFLLALLDNQENGVVRVSIKCPGTVSGRMSAGGLD